jgi:hypothetical protein
MNNQQEHLYLADLERRFSNSHELFSANSRKAYIDPEIARLREKPLIALYEEKQQLQILSKIHRSSIGKRAWRRNRYRKPYQKRLAQLSEVIQLSLGDSKSASERIGKQ